MSIRVQAYGGLGMLLNSEAKVDEVLDQAFQMHGSFVLVEVAVDSAVKAPFCSQDAVKAMLQPETAIGDVVAKPVECIAGAHGYAPGPLPSGGPVRQWPQPPFSAPITTSSTECRGCRGVGGRQA